MRQRRHPIADGGEPASVLVDRLLRHARSIAFSEQLLEQPLPPHADQPVRTGRRDVESARTNRGRPRAGMQVRGVDQRAIDIDQRRHAADRVDARGHVTLPPSSQEPARAPVAGCPAQAASDPAHRAAWAARGSAATDPAAPAWAARPAAAAWTTLRGSPSSLRPGRWVGCRKRLHRLFVLCAGAMADQGVGNLFPRDAEHVCDLRRLMALVGQPGDLVGQFGHVG